MCILQGHRQAQGVKLCLQGLYDMDDNRAGRHNNLSFIVCVIVRWDFLIMNRDSQFYHLNE